MKVRDFIKIYGAIILFHLAVVYRGDEGQMLWLSKPLILVSLLLFAFSKIREGAGFLMPLIPALVFSLFGDVALMFQQGPAFLIGMGAFALAHIAYSYWYLKQGTGLKWQAFVIALVLALAAMYALLQLVILPEELSIPIYGYFGLLSLHFILSAMAWQAQKISIWPLLGIALFIFSDWWIAWSKFGGALDEHWHNRFIIMLTYGLAQGLILLGIIARKA
ncbi:lysoplasmalogenase family protein [Croceimicrobium sp.]|uniref:lysoplasmalogenase family protein n=1 Tax=Croceimicrobium sp. TaxID=2828340 RepID=UPI003BAB8B1A